MRKQDRGAADYAQGGQKTYVSDLTRFAEMAAEGILCFVVINTLVQSHA
jgi:hypothetical protein